MEFSLNEQKKENSGGLGKSEVWNGQSLIVHLIKMKENHEKMHILLPPFKLFASPIHPLNWYFDMHMYKCKSIYIWMLNCEHNHKFQKIVCHTEGNESSHISLQAYVYQMLIHLALVISTYAFCPAVAETHTFRPAIAIRRLRRRSHSII